MSSRAERIRRQLRESGSPLFKHSTNQRSVKWSVDGERRLGFVKDASESEFKKFMARISEEEVYQYLLGEIQYFEEAELHVPERVGKLAYAMCSLVNRWAKEDIDKFVELAEVPAVAFTDGSPNERLIPVGAMVGAVAKDLKLQVNASTVKHLTDVAKTFASNLGAVRFFERSEIAAVDAYYALFNLTGYIAGEIKDEHADAKTARRMVVVFGQTVNRQLTRRK